MHPQTTNILTQTRDVFRFGFESTGALELDNEYSGREAEIRYRGSGFGPVAVTSCWGTQSSTW